MKMKNQAVQKEAATSQEDIGGENEDEDLSKLKYLCKKGMLEMFIKLLEDSKIDINQEFFDDDDGITLLHIASSCGRSEIVKYLLEAGANPTLKIMERDPTKTYSKKFIMLIGMTAYDMASDKETRNVFRRFYYQEQEKWNYQEAHIPSYLSPEMEEEAARKKQKKKTEKKRKTQAQKQKKLNKNKTIKEESENDEAEKGRSAEEDNDSDKSKSSGSKSVLKKFRPTTLQSFGMSPEMRKKLDREKRAQAAMARLKNSSMAGGISASTAATFVNQGSSSSSGSSQKEGNVCYSCGKSFASGQVPFSVMDKKFCSTNCVRVFRLSTNN